MSDGNAEKTAEKTVKQRLKELEVKEKELDIKRAELDVATLELNLSQELWDDHISKASPRRQGVATFDGAKIGWDSCRSVSDFLLEQEFLGSDHIVIEFSSPGGDVFAGLKLFDEITRFRNNGDRQVTTVCRGYSASMAAVLLQAGDDRVIGSESLLMLHEISTGAIGKAFELRDEAEFADRVTRRICDIFARRSRLNSDEIFAKIDRRDWWITAEEAVDLGFADRVG